MSKRDIRWRRDGARDYIYWLELDGELTNYYVPFSWGHMVWHLREPLPAPPGHWKSRLVKECRSRAELEAWLADSDDLPRPVQAERSEPSGQP